MRTGWRDIGGVLGAGGRLLVAHWPMLLTLAFLGVAVRGAALWAAVEVSDRSSFVGQLFLIAAPLGYLLPIIAMLHLMRPSLPAVSTLAASPGPEATTEGRERRLVDVAVSFLVPFLAVYVSYGLMEEDRLRFTNEAAFDEFNQFDLTGEVEVDFAGRIGIYPFQVMVLIVLAAWVVRWALGRFERRVQFLGIAFAGALVEVFYTGQAARQLEGAQSQATQWLGDRVAVDWVQQRYDASVGALGPLANPVDTATTWLFGLVGSLDAVVVVPVAWLTVAAVVLGHKLSPPPEPRADRLGRVPGPVRRGAASLFGDLVERWSAFWGGLRLLFSAGLVPMLLFGLVFLLVLRVPLLVSHVVRLVVGPTHTDVWLAFSPWEGGLGLALSMALIAPLLAAAVEWLVGGRLSEVDPDDEQVTAAGTARRTPASRSRS